MTLSKEEVKHVAKLAKLEFSDDEIDQFTEKLSSVLEYVNKLKELDTGGVEPTYHPHTMNNIMREDIVEKSLSREEVLKNAPESEKGYFKIPKVLD